MPQIYFVLGFLFVLGACASSTKDAEPPTIRLTNLRLGSIGLLSQELFLDLKLGNPNDFDLPLTGLTFALDVNGNFLADGLSDQRVNIPRLGFATVTVTGTTDTLNVLRQLMSLGEASALDYKISGTAYFGRMGVRRAVPYTRSGSVSLMPGPVPSPPPSRSSPPETRPDEVETLAPLKAL